MTRFLILVLLFSPFVQAGSLERMIGRMLVVGFDTPEINASSKVVDYIKRYDLGGVILFDRFYEDRNRSKNIQNPAQLQALTKALESYSNKPLLIALDQEGGKVERLKAREGFVHTPSANAIGSENEAKAAYDALSNMLHVNGINTNFAPVVDLAVNPKNRVIYQLGRSYGDNPLHVSRYADIFLHSMRQKGIIGALKHFPGHGSSLGDSHEGFVDITKTWSEIELEPYKKLIQKGAVQMIMSAHVFNAKLDPKYPATLSYKINIELLRNRMGYHGVIISDDMQMKAISANYSLKEAVTLAINSGVDMLLFGEQLGHEDFDALIRMIAAQVKSGAIKRERIIEANRRIEALHVSRRIIDKPIDFGSERIAMSYAYRKQHYGIEAPDIRIDPKIIVLHWTAVPTLERSFGYLKPQKLLSIRGDIADAGALNVSAHFMIDRDGTIYRLMPEYWMARHVIGLNNSSIGIENVGGEGNAKEDLTPEQVAANIALVRYLKSRYPDIEYLIGHHEYRRMESTPLWLEKDSGYRTEKSDPGLRFMRAVRSGVNDLNLKSAP